MLAEFVLALNSQSIPACSNVMGRKKYKAKYNELSLEIDPGYVSHSVSLHGSVLTSHRSQRARVFALTDRVPQPITVTEHVTPSLCAVQLMHSMKKNCEERPIPQKLR